MKRLTAAELASHIPLLIEAYREALKVISYYADENNWKLSTIDKDCGQRAREYMKNEVV